MRVPRFAARYIYGRAERQRARGQIAAAHRNLARAARAGHAPAQHALAHAYQFGQGCVRSGALAKHWYAAAAEQGYVDAQFELGLILLNAHDLTWMAGASEAWLRRRAVQDTALVDALFPAGLKSSSDPAAAYSWLQRAAEAGKPEAQANVGWLLLTGKGCVINREEAHRWLAAAAAYNISQAALGLAEYYKTVDAANFDLTQSADWAKKASELGNSSGSHMYGIALRDGAGVERSLIEAESYFSRASEQGHRYAGYEEAVLALARKPSPAEIDSIVERLRLCAKRDHIPSALLLADLYGRGDRVKPDLREAAHWYRVAADLGNAQAQFMTGCLYARGEAVGLDLRHAARYFELAANGGHVQAAFNLGVFRLNGQGVERSVTEAKRWFVIAADRGLVQAQLRLGQILELEASNPQELASARALIERASAHGSSEAKLTLGRRLLAGNTPDQVRRALSLLREAMNAGEVEASEVLLHRESAGPDLDAVLQSLQQAVRNGSSRAKAILGEALLLGERLPKDIPSGIALLNEAAAAKEARAHFLLGVLFCQGAHVSKDLAQGHKHYVEAAQLNDGVAQYNAGVMLLQGLGVEKNAEDGIGWIRRAASNGVEAAAEFIQSLERDALLTNAHA